MTTKKNRLPLDAIMACLADYAEACRAEGEAKADYDGYSWDYHGSRYIEAVENAQKDAEKEIEAYIDACVKAELEDLGVSGWQPIETAPIGTVFIGLTKTDYAIEAYIPPKVAPCALNPGGEELNLTHWMPRPKTPA